MFGFSNIVYFFLYIQNYFSFFTSSCHILLCFLSPKNIVIVFLLLQFFILCVLYFYPIFLFWYLYQLKNIVRFHLMPFYLLLSLSYISYPSWIVQCLKFFNYFRGFYKKILRFNIIPKQCLERKVFYLFQNFCLKTN